MGADTGERLRAVRRCALATSANLPFFGRRSQIAWRRSAVVDVPVPLPVDPDVLVAACLAALAPFCDPSLPGVDMRIGLARERDGQQQVLPVVVSRPVDNPTSGAWLRQVRASIIQAERFFGGLPVEDIELLIGQPRTSSNGRRTLFSVLVDPTIRARDESRDLLNDATVIVVDNGLRLVYDGRLFAAEIAAEWLGRVGAALGSLSNGKDLLSDAIADNADVGSTRPVIEPRDAPDVINTISAVAAASPDAPALVCSDDTVTYADLLTCARAVASWLAAQEVKSGQVIGLLAYPGKAFVAGLLGILYQGGVPAVLDVQSPVARLASATESTAMPVLLTDHARRDTAEGIVGQSHAGSAMVADLDQIIDGEHSDAIAEAAQMAPGAPGYVLFTSGSTGQPKGVVQTRRTLNVIADWQVRRSGPGSRLRTIQRSALSFDVSLQEIFSTLADGGCLYLLPDEVRHDMSEVARFISANGVERMFITPSGLQAMLTSASATDLTSLREIICAGEPLVISGTMRKALREIGVRLDNQYGPTETHVCVAGEVEGDPFTWPDRPLIGTALPGMSVCVVDARLRPVPVGAPGELLVAGPTVALGYVTGDGGFGAEPKPCPEPRRRWYRTGDRVREHPDGRLEFLGRADHQVKIRGYRVELAEVEAAATQTGLVSEAVAFALRRGDRVDRLGLAVFNAGAPADKAAVLAAMAQKLPSYMLPRRGEVVVLDAIPTTRSGKADRQRVIKLASHRIGEQGHHAHDTDVVRLRALWQRTLGVDHAGDDETFLELGGDSLAAVELAAALQDGFGVTVSLREILEGMSFRRLRELPMSGGGKDMGGLQAAGSSAGAAWQAGQLATIELPAFGAVACLLPTEARHLYLDVVVCGTYAQFGMLAEPLTCVVDVGANIGIFSLQILARNPETRVVAIEPHPGLAAALRANLASRAVVIEAACGAKTQTGTLFTYSDMPAMSSLISAQSYDSSLMAALMGNDLARIGVPAPEVGQHAFTLRPAEPIAVPTWRLSEMLKEHEITAVSLLKIDVQHGELDVLAGIDDEDWSRVERVVVEVQDRDGQGDRVRSVLEGHGFTTAAHRDDMLHLGCPVTFLYGWAPGVRTTCPRQS